MTNVRDDTSMVPFVTQLNNELEASFITQGYPGHFNYRNGDRNRVTIIGSYFVDGMKRK